MHTRMRTPPTRAWALRARTGNFAERLPTGFSRITGLTTSGQEGEEPPPAPPLPERFARERARRDYLRWGESTPATFYLSTSRVELCKPSVQAPLGGRRSLDGRVVATDTSGYHLQVTQSPVTPDVGC